LPEPFSFHLSQFLVDSGLPVGEGLVFLE
jgi:hypothetical protein